MSSLSAFAEGEGNEKEKSISEEREFMWLRARGLMTSSALNGKSNILNNNLNNINMRNSNDIIRNIISRNWAILEIMEAEVLISVNNDIKNIHNYYKQ